MGWIRRNNFRTSKGEGRYLLTILETLLFIEVVGWRWPDKRAERSGYPLFFVSFASRAKEKAKKNSSSNKNKLSGKCLIDKTVFHNLTIRMVDYNPLYHKSFTTKTLYSINFFTGNCAG